MDRLLEQVEFGKMIIRGLAVPKSCKKEHDAMEKDRFCVPSLV